MADVTPKTGSRARLVGFGCFLLFEVSVYYLLKLLTSGLGMPDQNQPENTIVSNWVKAVIFLLLYLLLVVVAVLVLSNRLPRHYRGQVMGWFYLSLVLGFVLLFPLFG